MNSVIEKKFISLLCKFRPEELPDIIDTSFGDFTSWEDVKSTAVSFKLSLLNVRKLATIVLKVIHNVNPSSQVIQSALWHLQFYDAVLHNNIVWNCAVLKDEVESFPSNFIDLEQRVIRSYRTEARNTEFIGKAYQNIIWIMLIEKIITKRGIKHGKPFLAAFMDEMEKKYVFYFPKYNSQSSGPDHLFLLSKALGFESYKRVHFEGRDVRSMFRMIQRNLKKEPQCVVYRPSKVLFEGNTVDFTQSRDRKDYALSVLPPGSTNLSEFSAKSSIPWRGPTPLWQAAPITSSVTIRVKRRNSSIEDVLRQMISIRLIPIPIPDYIRRLPYLNKNSVKIVYNSIEDDEEGRDGEDETVTEDMDY